MIKLTRLDGSEMYVNEDLIELIEETPDTHLTLNNGNRYLVLEKASIILEKIILFKARIQISARRNLQRKSRHAAQVDDFHPFSRL
jgi:flagellar protein FlbD